MINKKIIFITILLISIFAISAVSAAENVTDDAGAADEILSSENDEIQSTQNDEILSAGGEKTFADLNETINGNTDTEISLDYDYKYTDDDSDFIDGIVIKRNVTVNGNNHTIDGNLTARIFKLDENTDYGIVFKNINFINGKADECGAIYGICTAVNCNFTNNQAQWGGAMGGGSAVNCNFNNNQAVNAGGAMVSGSAVNCTFINNYATYGGGAMFYGSAVNCTFNSNGARETAGAMVFGSADTCICNGNTAGASDSDYYNTTILNPILSVFNYTSTYNSGEKLKFNFTTNSGIVLPAGNITVRISQNGNIIKTITCLSAEGWTVDLDRGTYTAECKATLYNSDVKKVTITVLPYSFKSLNYTINSNQDAEIILNDDYCYYSRFDSNFTEGIIINRSVTINGNGHTIDGNLTARIFNITGSNVTLTNITFTKGKITGNGGAILWTGDNGAAIECTFTDNKADGGFSDGFGGAIYWNGANGTVKNAIFINNVANHGGAIRWFAPNCTVKNAIFINNVAYTDGGAIGWEGVNATVTNTTFINNTSKGEYGQGGAIRLYDSNYIVTNCTFTNNTSEDCGAALMGYGHYSKVVNCTFTNNRANNRGGGVFLSGNNCTVLTCKFTDNFADSSGGAMYKDDYVNTTVANCTFTNNRAYDAGAVRWYGNNGELTNCTFTNNSARHAGGAIKWYRNNGKIADCVFTNNTADNYDGCGGAIYWDGKNSELTNCTFTNNTAEYGGGAVYWRDYYGTLTNCTFINNLVVNSYGGAIYWCDKYGTVTNSLFINNSVNKQVGGAIFLQDDNCEVTNCTLINNNATNGSAVYLQYSDNSSVSGCYFVNNTGANTVYGYYSKSCVINDNIFLNNNGTEIFLESATVDRDYNWFGNNATNYNVKPESAGNTWLYFNATADTNNLILYNSTVIVFKLYCYNSTSQYNNTLLKPVNLTITSTKGTVDKKNIGLGETITYTANEVGMGSVTATVENVKYTIQFNIRFDPDLSVDSQEITYPENATLTLSYNQTATGKVNITLKGKNQNYSFNKDLNKTVTLENINSDEYNVTVTYSGDDNFINATATATLKVNKATIEVLSVDELNIVYGMNNTLTFAGKVNNTKFGSNYTGNVTLSIEGMSNSSSVNPDGSFAVVIVNDDVGKISAGKHNVSVAINGDDNYNYVEDKSFSDVLSVVPATITVVSVDNITVVYGTNNTITVTGKVNSTKFGANYTGNVTVSVEGMKNSLNGNSDGSFAVVIVNEGIGKLSAGKYNVSVAIEGDANYNPAQSKSFDNVLTVVPATIAIQSVENISIVYGVNNTVTVTGKLNSTKYGDNYTGEITVNIENQLTNTSNALNGEFRVVINGVKYWNAGEYTIAVKGNQTENYNSLSEKTAVLKITKNQFEIDANITSDVKTDQNAVVTIDVTNIPTGEFDTAGVIIANVSGINKNYSIAVPITNNTIKLDIIATPGTYTLNVQYTGNKDYNPSNMVTKTFKVTSWNETDLQELIDSSTGNVTLEHNYIFTNENATVNVTGAVTINGNGHTIDANGSATAINITSDNVTVANMAVTNANGIAISSNGTNTLISNVNLTDINGIAIKLSTDNSTVTNITATNIIGALIDVTGDNNTISNINATGNAAIKVEGKGNIIENVTGAKVIPKISATSSVKGNDVIITAAVTAPEGNVTVQFQGKKFTVPLTDGKAVITIPNVGSGTYNDVAVNYEGTSLYQSVSTKTSFTSKVAITGNKDGSIDYLSVYSVRITNAEGNYASGVTVKMTINGKTYNVKTDKDGYAKMTINLKPKTYTITVQYLNVKKTNKIKVKSTIKLVKKTVKVKKTAKKLVLKAKLKWSTGKAIKGKIVKFKFKGKTYKAKTNKKGIAKVKIKKKVIKKLKKGKKYKFKAKYGKEYVKGKVKVKK